MEQAPKGMQLFVNHQSYIVTENTYHMLIFISCYCYSILLCTDLIMSRDIWLGAYIIN